MGGPLTTGLSGRIAGSGALFVGDRCEVVDAGVATARVVPGFDPFENRLGQLGFGVPSLSVEEFTLQRGPNDSIMVSPADEATRPIEPGSPAWRSRFPNAQEVQPPVGGCGHGVVTDADRFKALLGTLGLVGRSALDHIFGARGLVNYLGRVFAVALLEGGPVGIVAADRCWDLALCWQLHEELDARPRLQFGEPPLRRGWD